MRLSKVRIFPRVATQVKKKANFKGTLVRQMLFQGK